MTPKKMLQILKAWILKTAWYIYDHILGIILGTIISAIGLIAAFAKNLLFFLIEWLQLPTPLWLAITLTCLSCLLVYRIQNRNLSCLHSPIQKSNEKPSETIEYFTVAGDKWKTHIYSNGFSIEKIPLCDEHDLSLIFVNRHWTCPAFVTGDCKTNLTPDQISARRNFAESIIDRDMRKRSKV